MEKLKKILIIAGPNGAGKTTFAQEFLPREADCLNFVNADLIASGLSPFSPEIVAIKAARIMIKEINDHIQNDENFAFETTLSGRLYSRLIPEWRKKGYTVKLFFLKLNSVDMAIARVCQRVMLGGHNVEEGVIRRRFKSGLINLETVYKPIVDEWVLYDNSGEQPLILDGGNRS